MVCSIDQHKKGGNHGQEISEKGSDRSQHCRSCSRHRRAGHRCRRLRRRSKGCRWHPGNPGSRIWHSPADSGVWYSTPSPGLWCPSPSSWLWCSTTDSRVRRKENRIAATDLDDDMNKTGRKSSRSFLLPAFCQSLCLVNQFCQGNHFWGGGLFKGIMPLAC